MSERKKDITIEKDGPYIRPGLLFSTAELTEARDFYQFITPKKELSPLSEDIENIFSEMEKTNIWAKMLLIAKAKDSDFVFNKMLMNKIIEIDKLQLSDQHFLCEKNKGFLNYNNPNNKGIPEHKLDALFKRIRNSLAHGRVYKNDNFFVFEDKSKQQMTGRIVLSPNVLADWKAYLESLIN